MTYINHDLAYIRLNKYKGMPFTRKQEPSGGDAYNTILRRVDEEKPTISPQILQRKTQEKDL